MASTSPPDTAFGERLRRLRTSRGLTQGELAARAKIGKRSVELYERGQVPRKAIPALAKALDVSSHYLTHGVDPLETRIDTLTDRMTTLENHIDVLEGLLERTAEATWRMYTSMDGMIRLLLTHVGDGQLLSSLPAPVTLDGHPQGGADGDGHQVERVGGALDRVDD